MNVIISSTVISQLEVEKLWLMSSRGRGFNWPDPPIIGNMLNTLQLTLFNKQLVSFLSEGADGIIV